MASDQSSTMNTAKGFGHLPLIRQVGLLVGLSASIALGFAVVLWSQEPNYRPLFSHLTPQETSDVLDALQMTGIQYKLDKKTGDVLVPADDVYNARFRLADEGLPKSHGAGFEMLEKEQGFGTSRFMETARYRRALEGELSRTIGSLSNVHFARVHLAMPKESVFVNDHRSPSASVLVDIAAGQHLRQNQVAAIAHMVASSVPNMDPKDVTVVDQRGELLTDGEGDDRLAKTQEQFEYTRKLESQYAKRIENLLTPLLGLHKVKARVSADIDFTQVEQTQEQYLPNEKAVRSEQIFNEAKENKGNAAGGAPGALANQPPQEPAAQNPNPGAEGQEAAVEPQFLKRQSTRNYELGKTISHTQLPTGSLRHLSVAVVVDDHTKVDPKSGEVTRTPLTEEEITKITKIVENAVGINQERGDKLSVANIPFAEPEKAEEPPPLPIWQQHWFWNVVKTSAAALFVLLLVFMVLRPVLKGLAAKGKDIPDALPGGMPGGAGMDPMQQQMMMQQGGMLPGGMAGNPQMLQQNQMQMMQQLAGDDPKKMAQVMKAWVGDEGNG